MTLKEITQVTIKGDSGTTSMRAKVTKCDDGYTIEKLAEPKFTVGEQFVTASGKLGKIISDPEFINGKYTYDIKWATGAKNNNQPEDSMIKIEEAFK